MAQHLVLEWWLWGTYSDDCELNPESKVLLESTRVFHQVKKTTCLLCKRNVSKVLEMKATGSCLQPNMQTIPYSRTMLLWGQFMFSFLHPVHIWQHISVYIYIWGKFMISDDYADIHLCFRILSLEHCGK